MEFLQRQHESVAYSVELRGDNRQHGNINTVELVKATPGTTLTQAREDLTHSLGRETTHSYNKEEYPNFFNERTLHLLSF